MRTRFLLVTIMLLIITGTVPGSSWSQLPVRSKRSNELTQSAVQSIKDKKFDQARIQLNQAIRLNPKNVPAHEILAVLHYQEHNFLEAMKQARIALEYHQQSPRALYVLGLINFQQGNQDQAKTQLEQSVRSLKDPEERTQAKVILSKIRAHVKERVANAQTKIESLAQEPGHQADALEYKPYVAVFPFDDANARATMTKLGQTLTEMLITGLIQVDKFTVMERVQLEKILQEQSLGQTGVIDVETAMEVGKLSGLEAVVIGSISQLRTAIEADARLIAVETGRAFAAVNAKVNNVDNLRDLATSLAKQLSTKAYLMAPVADSTHLKAPDLEQ